MADNAAGFYGLDIACATNDADELFSEVEGLDVVVQDTIHVLTSDSFLGPGGDARGYDCRKLVGMLESEAQALQPVLESIIKDDDRISEATVKITFAIESPGIEDVFLDVSCVTAAGPFRFTKSVAQLIEADLEEQNQ